MGEKSCGKCGDEIEGGYTTLHHVSYSGDMFSKMVSSMDVHGDCLDEMRESERWSW